MVWPSDDVNGDSCTEKDNKQSVIETSVEKMQEEEEEEGEEEGEEEEEHKTVVTTSSSKGTVELSVEEIRKRCIRFITRNCKRGKSLEDTNARMIKKYGGVLTFEEFSTVYNNCASKIAAAAASTTTGDGTQVENEITSSPMAKKRHRTEGDSSEGGSSKKKHIGRPPDEEKQRTIISMVEHNPAISLRTVAAELDCSKSQVARVLALNGFQRNKGRVGEWQRVPTDQASNTVENESNKTPEIPVTNTSDTLLTTPPPPPVTSAETPLSSLPEDPALKAKTEEEDKRNEDVNPGERPRKKKRTKKEQ